MTGEQSDYRVADAGPQSGRVMLRPKADWNPLWSSDAVAFGSNPAARCVAPCKRGIRPAEHEAFMRRPYDWVCGRDGLSVELPAARVSRLSILLHEILAAETIALQFVVEGLAWDVQRFDGGLDTALVAGELAFDQAFFEQVHLFGQGQVGAAGG